jgi:hypothetical protein
MPRKPPAGLPASAGVLAKYVQAYAREAGVTEGRVRGWISYMVMAGMLERAAAAGQPRFIVKGGIALELRLRDRARATKDIDVVLQDAEAELARTLEGAITGETYQDFSFRRKGEPLLLDNGTVNIELAVTYRGGAWTSIAVDIARAEPGEAENWPPALAVPPHWTDPFARMAADLDLPVTDANTAMERVQALVHRVLQTASPPRNA